MKITPFIILSVLFAPLAQAEQACDTEVEVVKAYGQQEASGGSLRDGVSASKPGLPMEEIMKVVSKEGNNLSDDEMDYAVKSMYFCTTDNGPVSGHSWDFNDENCTLIKNAVGVRIKADIYTEGGAVAIESVAVKGSSPNPLLRPGSANEIYLLSENLDAENSSFDICFDGSSLNAVKIVTVLGNSINPDNKGSRGNVTVEVLTAKPATQTLK